MQVSTGLRAIAATLLALAALALAPQNTLREALNLGHTRDDALYDAFNRGYQLSVSGTIDSAEIITEFRRAVMLVREGEATGTYLQDAHALSVALAPYAGRVTVIVQARLNPLNTYAKTPAYELYISTGPSTKAIGPKPFARDPVYPVGGGGPGSPIVAVRLTATFPRADIDAAPQPSLVVTDDRAEVIWQARLDLSRYR